MSSHFQALLNRNYAHYRLDRLPNGQGGWQSVPVLIGAIRGRLRPAGGSEQTVGATEERAITHVFYCVASEDVRRDDLLAADQLTVKVQGVREPSRADHHLEVDCLEMQVVMEEQGS